MESASRISNARHARATPADRKSRKRTGTARTGADRGRAGRQDHDRPSLPQESYSISELARAFSITPRTIRFYESKGLLMPARRGQARIYGRRDRARLSLILRGKRVGFSLDEIKDMLDLYDLRDGQETQLRHAVAKFDERIAALEAQRRDIDLAIDELRDGQITLKELLAEKQGRGTVPGVVGFAVAGSLEPDASAGPVAADFSAPNPRLDEGLDEG